MHIMSSTHIKLLLVEDHRDTATALARLLGMEGFEVTTAENADAALALCREQTFDLLICDIQLPGHDGNWLMRQLSAMCGIRGIALTGLAMPDEVEDGVAAGFSEYLVKPVDASAIVSAIGRVMGRPVRGNAHGVGDSLGSARV
jgi:CheY-like chemotaxis protein